MSNSVLEGKVIKKITFDTTIVNNKRNRAKLDKHIPKFEKEFCIDCSIQYSIGPQLMGRRRIGFIIDFWGNTSTDHDRVFKHVNNIHHFLYGLFHTRPTIDFGWGASNLQLR